MPLTDYIKERIQNNVGSILKLSNAGLQDKHMDEVIELINANPHVTTLYLDFNNIRTEGAKKLILLSHVNSLYISRNNFHDEAAILIASNRQFTSLDLSRNRSITDMTGHYLANHAHHIALVLSGTNISLELCEKISERVKNNLKNYYANINKSKAENLSEMPSDEIWDEKTALTSPINFFCKSTVRSEDNCHVSEEKYSPSTSILNTKSFK